MIVLGDVYLDCHLLIKIDLQHRLIVPNKLSSFGVLIIETKKKVINVDMHSPGEGIHDS